MPYRPKYKKSDGTVVDLPLEAETTVKLKTSRSIGLSGVTATSQSFNGTSAITIPVTAVPGSLLTGSTLISTSGNAGTATKLATARTIGVSGVTGTAQSFDGSENITIPITAVPGSLLTGSTSISTSGNAGSATKLATARTIGLSGVTATAQSFNGTGNITIPITAVPGSIVTGTVSTDTTGNAATATKLKTARTIGVSGVTGTAQSFDGSSNITIPITAVPASLITGSISASQISVTPSTVFGSATTVQGVIDYIAKIFTGEKSIAKLSTVILNLVDSASSGGSSGGGGQSASF